MSQRLAGAYSGDRVAITIDLPTLLGVSVAVPISNGLTLPHAIDGRGTDAFLSVAREVANNSKVTGVDGEVMVNESKNVSGSFTITTQMTSVSNIVLSGMLTAWENGLKFYFPLTVVDLSSVGSIYSGDECWIQGWPEASFGAAGGTLAWVIETSKLRMFHGAYGIAG